VFKEQFLTQKTNICVNIVDRSVFLTQIVRKCVNSYACLFLTRQIPGQAENDETKRRVRQTDSPVIKKKSRGKTKRFAENDERQNGNDGKTISERRNQIADKAYNSFWAM